MVWVVISPDSITEGWHNDLCKEDLSGPITKLPTYAASNAA